MPESALQTRNNFIKPAKKNRFIKSDEYKLPGKMLKLPYISILTVSHGIKFQARVKDFVDLHLNISSVIYGV